MHNAQKTAYAAKRISNIEGYSVPFSAPNFNEFVVRGPRLAEEILDKLRRHNNIIGGLPLSKYYANHDNDFLVCVTETSSKSQIDDLAEALASQ